MLTLISILELRKNTSPDKLAYVELDKNGMPAVFLTYKELYDYTVQFRDKNIYEINRFDRVLISLPSGLKFIKTFFGVLALGGIPIASDISHPLFWKRSRYRLISILEDAKPQICITLMSNKEYIEEAVHLQKKPLASKIYFLDAQYKNMIIKQRSKFDLNNSDIALIQYTSGTLEKPKGVMLTHSQILKNLKAICSQTQQDENCRFVTWLPHSHDMGLIGGLLVPFSAGGTCYILDTIQFLRNPLNWLSAISINKATSSPSPAFGYDLCSRDIEKAEPSRYQLDLSTWSVAYIGAELIRRKSLERFIKNFAIFGFKPEAMYPCYGLAEATLMVTGSPKRRPPQYLVTNNIEYVSCGEAVPGVEIQILDVEEKKKCSDMKLGEIWVKGESISSGYWNKSDKSLSALNNNNQSDLDNFLNTKDLGFIKDNELYVAGRSDDILIIHAEKYTAEEIEQVVKNSDPLLQDSACAAVGVNEDAQSVNVIVEIEPELLNNKMHLQSLKIAISKNIGESYFLRVDVCFIKRGSLIKTTSGKVSRKASRKLHQSTSFTP